MQDTLIISLVNNSAFPYFFNILVYAFFAASLKNTEVRSYGL